MVSTSGSGWNASYPVSPPSSHIWSTLCIGTSISPVVVIVTGSSSPSTRLPLLLGLFTSSSRRMGLDVSAFLWVSPVLSIAGYSVAISPPRPMGLGSALSRTRLSGSVRVEHKSSLCPLGSDEDLPPRLCGLGGWFGNFCGDCGVSRLVLIVCSYMVAPPVRVVYLIITPYGLGCYCFPVGVARPVNSRVQCGCFSAPPYGLGQCTVTDSPLWLGPC
jgi:hypothetical protein